MALNLSFLARSQCRECKRKAQRWCEQRLADIYANEPSKLTDRPREGVKRLAAIDGWSWALPTVVCGIHVTRLSTWQVSSINSYSGQGGLLLRL